jgi:hypothetical protein
MENAKQLKGNPYRINKKRTGKKKYVSNNERTAAKRRTRNILCGALCM